MSVERTPVRAVTAALTAAVVAAGVAVAGVLAAAPAQAADFVAPRALPQTVAVSQHGLAVTPAGNVRSWGYDAYGQLGRGTKTPAHSDPEPGTVVGPDGTGRLSNIVQVAAGLHTSYAVRSDGTVWAWGDGSRGQLGSGDGLHETARPEVVRSGDAPLAGVVAVAAGQQHALALTSDGSVWSWGSNDYGALGVGGTGGGFLQATRVQAARGVPLTRVVQIAAGLGTSYALLANGQVKSWGLNDAYQLGVYPHGGGSSSYPVDVNYSDGGTPTPLTGVVAIAAGQTHGVALVRSGAVYAWGGGAAGQTGAGDEQNQDVAFRVPSGATFLSIHAGPLADATFARDSSGRVWAFGDTGASLHTGGTATKWSVPRQIPALSNDTTFRTIAVGRRSGLAARTTGALRGWGSDTYGKLGDGSQVRSDEVIPSSAVGVVGAPALFVRIAPTLSAAPAVGRTISVSHGTWGLPATSYAYQWLRDGAPIRGATRAAYKVTTADRGRTLRARVVASRYGYPAGTATTGIATPARATSPVPPAFAAPAAGPAVIATSFHALAVTPGAAARGWGYNGYGQLGRGAADEDGHPSAGTVALTRVVQVAAGGYSSCALRGDGSVWCWGLNGNGQLGNNSTTQSARPVRVVTTTGAPLTAIVSIAAGLDHVVALRSDGTVWSWGDSDKGQLGWNGYTDSPSAGRLPGVGGFGSLSDAVSIAAGGNDTYVVRRSGEVVSSGDNASGQLGGGRHFTTTSVPEWVTSPDGNGDQHLTGVVAVAGGQQHALALRRDGTVYAWGVNGIGQLGVDDHEARFAPARVTALPRVSGVFAGPYAQSSFAIGRDGTVFGWGEDGNGNLGDGGTADTDVPVRVVGLGAGSGVRALAAGVYSSLAVRTNGQSLSWGGSPYGAGGTGDTSASGTPRPASSVGPAGPPALMLLALPVTSGTAAVGRTLAVTPGTWGLPATSVRYQWLRNGSAIPRATGRAYKLTVHDRGRRVSCRVTAARYGYPAGAYTTAARAVR